MNKIQVIVKDKVLCRCDECKQKKRQIHLRMACRRKDLPHPDDAGSIDITGRYEEDKEHPRFTCQINQAGVHIEGWLQIVFVAIEGNKAAIPRSSQAFTLSGDLDLKSREFLFVVYDDWSKSHGQGVGQGLLKLLAQGCLAMNMTIEPPIYGMQSTINTILRPYLIGKREKAKPRQKAPRLSEYALAALPVSVRKELVAVESIPLPTPYINALQKEFSPQEISKVIEDWNSVPQEPPSDRDLRRRKVLGTLAAKVRKFFVWFHSSLWPTLRWHFRNFLSSYTYRQDSNRSLLGDLEMIYSQTPHTAEEYEFLGKKGLDLVWKPGVKEPYFYEADLKSLSFSKSKYGVGGGLWKCLLKINKSSSKMKKPATYYFDVLFTVVGIGADVGYNLMSENSGLDFAFDDWQAMDFHGDAVMYDISVWWGMVKGGSYGITKLRVYGNKAHIPLNFDMSGWSEIFAQGVGIGASVIFGKVVPRKVKVPGKTHQKESKDFPLTGKNSAKSHFDLGCAVLDGELFYLMSPGSILRLDGYTDTVDCKVRNKELAKLRIQNVWQAIKDTMGKKLPIALYDAYTPNPLGEEPAFIGEWNDKTKKYEHKIDDDTDDRYWRRVDVFLNGRGMLRLQG